MIKHKLTRENKLPTEEIHVTIDREKYEEVERKLEYDHLEEWTDAQKEAIGYQEDSCETIFAVEFDDGAKLDWRLCCGQSNYYDEIFFQYPDGKFTDLDPSYEINDIEIETDNKIYRVILDLKGETK